MGAVQGQLPARREKEPMNLRISAVLLLAPLLACSAGPPRVAGLDGPGLVARVRQKYAKLERYADNGHATTRNEAGEDSVRFATTMDRSAGLRFEFGSDNRLEHSLIHSAEGTSFTILGETTQVNSLLGAVKQLAGASRLSALVMPSLLYGIDFCECFDIGTATLLDTPPTAALTTVRIQARPDRYFDLLIDAKTLTIREVRFTRNELFGGRAPYTVLSYDHVNIP